MFYCDINGKEFSSNIILIICEGIFFLFFVFGKIILLVVIIVELVKRVIKN